MKKLLSFMMAILMSFTTLFAVPVALQAAERYDSNVINTNIDYIKNYIKHNGFLNGNGEYTLQHSGTYKSLRYYGLFLVNPNNNVLTLDYQLCDVDTDDIFSATTLEIPNASVEIMKTDVSYWINSTRYADLEGYAYIDKNFSHTTQTPVFYINNNNTGYYDDEAKRMCEDSVYLAFDEWNFMMKDAFAMNLGVLGFHSYCTEHVYGYNSNSCAFCGACKPAQVNTPSTNSSTPAKISKPKSAKISKLTAGKKQFKATWKKVSGVSGYQIQYSASSKFAKKSTKTSTVKGSKKTSVTVKKLKSKKKYYVRIRTYKTVNGQKVYSSWSKSKTVKIK